MNKWTLVAVTAGTLFAGQAMAAESNDFNPWTQCGIGAMIFEDNGTAAAISNVIWDLGTTAVSSKISSEDTCKGSEVKAAQFIQDNFDKVLEETSQGSGAHLTAMLEILDVEDVAQPQVIASVRADVAGKVVANEATPEVYYNAVMASL
ncbi:DUF3015 family protein [Enterovibrio nigricans]|uniref:DUF3015 family protein n=1 Tax=Enterovibrio nigricans TaxID=504469 RepID=UPI000999A6A5|nr:DUF3015 family protein [Enterovibrio nigricans]PKF50967.1 DUF3015 domain-containing protein [Enterovibrio nigricans]